MEILKKYKKGELRLDEFFLDKFFFEPGDVYQCIHTVNTYTVSNKAKAILKELNALIVVKSAQLDRLIAQQSKKTLHDVISLTKGRWGSSLDAVRLTNDARQIIYMDAPCFSSDSIFSKQEHDDYIAEIAADYASYKDEFEVVGKVSKAQSALGCGDKPAFTQAMKDAGELPPVGSFFIVNENKYIMIGVSSTGSVVGESELFAEYRGFLARDCKPIQSPEEKLIDDIQSILDSNIGASSEFIAKELVKEYSINKKE